MLLPFHGVKQHRLMLQRYFSKEPAIGAIPYELLLHDRYWENHLGLDTGGWVPVDLEDGMLYEATPYLLLYEILRHLDLGPKDVFVDLGCGKGRATCMASRSAVGRVVGVEQDENFLQIARENLEKVPKRQAPVEFFNGLAQQFDFDDTTVVFLFNPFGARTLLEVVDLLQQSLQRNPRKLRIVYVNPVHEMVLLGTEWLENVATWQSDAYPEFAIQPPNPRMVSFWQAKS
ncbi:MAG: class I SAM-dependent methyltransferase [Planctomycetes bacterium]|nr:class I SAM-dependent methyltransferase [Planctomycetota bacterium]MCP4771883.1 class I SAM-dependent methyltransferase [Planctomycetota bacterium]MCP4861881.1 class I SAM-dependent methyltransferase [Planctomycetota bacterium]